MGQKEAAGIIGPNGLHPSRLYFYLYIYYKYTYTWVSRYNKTHLSDLHDVSKKLTSWNPLQSLQLLQEIESLEVTREHGYKSKIHTIQTENGFAHRNNMV